MQNPLIFLFLPAVPFSEVLSRAAPEHLCPLLWGWLGSGSTPLLPPCIREEPAPVLRLKGMLRCDSGDLQYQDLMGKCWGLKSSGKRCIVRAQFGLRCAWFKHVASRRVLDLKPRARQ